MHSNELLFSSFSELTLASFFHSFSFFQYQPSGTGFGNTMFAGQIERENNKWHHSEQMRNVLIPNNNKSNEIHIRLRWKYCVIMTALNISSFFLFRHLLDLLGSFFILFLVFGWLCFISRFVLEQHLCLLICLHYLNAIHTVHTIIAYHFKAQVTNYTPNVWKFCLKIDEN